MAENILNLEGRYEFLFVLLFFICLSFIYLGANIFEGEIVAPMDLLLRYPGFSESEIPAPSFINHQRSDMLDVKLPKMIFEKNEIINGNLPLWDPTRHGGTPINIAPDLFKVDFLPFVIFDDGLGFTLGLMAKLIVGGFGAFLLCRQMFGTIPSIFGGITFMMFGFNASWLMHSHVTTSIWIPWVLWSIKIAVDNPSTKKIIIISLTVMMLVFGGFPYVTLIGIYLGLLFLGWLLFIKFKNEGKIPFRTFLYVFIGIFLGFMLGSVYLIPLTETVGNVDTSWRTGGSVLSFQDIDVLWNPFKYDNHSTPDHPVPNAEKSGYVGLLALFFTLIAFVGLFFNKRKIFTSSSLLFWAPVSLVVMIIIFQIFPFSSYLYQIFPFESSVNTRSIVILGLVFAILGSLGLQHTIKGLEGLCKKFKIHHRNKIIIFIFALTILSIHIIDISVVGRTSNAVVPSETFFPSTPTLDYVKDNLLPGQNVIATKAYIISGTLTTYGIPEWFAHGYLSSQEKNVLENLVKNPWSSPTSAAFVFDSINMDSSYMDAMFVKYVLANKSNFKNSMVSEKWNIINKGPNIVILENSQVPTVAYIVPDEKQYDEFDRNLIYTENIKLVEYSSDYSKYLITNDQKGLLVVPLRVWPGWEAFVNGQQTEIKSYLGILSSVTIDETPAEVEFKYVPQSRTSGIILSLLALLILVSLFLLENRMKKIQNSKKTI